MDEYYFALDRKDQDDVLEQAREKTGRPTHLLEKDVWVVWTLGVLFDSPLAADLTFKGGTSLAKAYKIIDRFSEDIDLSHDIRKLIADLTGGEDFLPASRSQASKWTKAVRDRLPEWIATEVQPLLQAALKRDRLEAKLKIGGAERDKLLLHYPAIKQGTGYVSPVVALEFGGRATGEPHEVLPVTCDMDGHVDGVRFPKASPMVMRVARTFWEKATAAHVFCAQGRIRSERYARHWHDLVAIMRNVPFFDAVIRDRAVARAVAAHKSFFFSEKDSGGDPIDYLIAVNGALQIVPEGAAREALAADYARMREDDVMVGNALPFDELMQACAEAAARANAAAH
ncbi:nucleotidyl transferase AbiEii/AbiGii toxin family protein [Verminephrobacter aporrectodeae subsp. tuberculatae]|uniref:nucleotidyl transferase AbiEii/AbiGii toxin family protein n=1 Tax=Verminephrobacter aporrectodeae TaxID=1110389 RepID=UPI002243D52D|nr:nucleotidyl transferase AbiEii/AbiGii toxin family protein [Verminephrobacter aporrectodeae]MCW8206158.1 nucleotidyl transferase AbiEii/AbiGii toxin family protein [Verminephrobacter aporrectodeae subsp. tuberculatae]